MSVQAMFYVKQINHHATSQTLQEQFGITDRRAKIARDQTSKLNSDLNKIRQQQAGVTTYKVRERQRKLDGKSYKWGEATGVENGLPPGQPINCRCLARRIVEFSGACRARRR
jgi:uncharacterized protein with gpF-like domain